jgi:hypothetical protein
MNAPGRSLTIGYRLTTFFLVFAVAFGAFLLVSLGIGIARGGNSPLWGSDLRVPVKLSPDEIRSLPHGLELSAWPHADLVVHKPSAKQMLLRDLQDLVPLALFIAGLWLVRGLLRAVLAGDPFGAGNVRRLRAIGLILVLGAPLVALVDYGLRQALFDDVASAVSATIGTPGFSFPGTAFVAGIAAYILAEIFAYGQALREDVEATV